MEEDELNDLFQAEGGECIVQRVGELVKGIGTARDRLGLFVQRGRRGEGGELSLGRDQEALCKLTPGAAGGKPSNAASFTAKKRGGARSL